MPTSIQKTSNTFLNNDKGFSLIEILVALVLAAMIFLAVPSGDEAEKHRQLQTAVDDIDRAVRFAANEAVLRNTVTRLRFSMDKSPVEYTVEYGPAGNLPLPEMVETASPSLAEEKAKKEKSAALDRNFTKVEEFEEIKHAIHDNVTILGIGVGNQKKIMTQGEANLYFYPTGEKDAGLVVFATNEEMSTLEVLPFLSETKDNYLPLKSESVAKLEDILQAKMEEVHREWLSK